MQDKILEDESFENAITVISSFCKEKVTRELLLENLVAGERNSDIKKLRDMYRL